MYIFVKMKINALLLIICSIFFKCTCVTGHINENATVDGVSKFIKSQFAGFGSHLATGVFDLQLPSLDPLPVRLILFDSNGIHGQFRQIKMYGLSSINLQSVKVNLLQKHLEASFNFPALNITGIYVINGLFRGMFPIRGEGNFTVTAYNSRADVIIELKRNEQRQTIDLAEYQQVISSGPIKQHFENLLGGGNLGLGANRLLVQLGNKIYNDAKPLLEKSLHAALRRKFIQVVRKIKISDRVRRKREENLSENFNDYLDEVLRHVARKIQANGMEPWSRPPLVYGYFEPGNIFGLSLIRRDGDAMAIKRGEDILLNFTLTFDNLTAVFGFRHWHFFTIRSQFTARIDHISLLLVLLLGPEHKPRVEELKIHNLGRVAVTVSNLGPFGILWGHMLEILLENSKHVLFAALKQPLIAVTEMTLNQLTNEVVVL